VGQDTAPALPWTVAGPSPRPCGAAAAPHGRFSPNTARRSTRPCRPVSSLPRLAGCVNESGRGRPRTGALLILGWGPPPARAQAGV